LAASAIATGDWRSAVRYCSHLVQLHPDHFQAWVNLGVARFHLDELADSEFAFRQAVKLRPDQALPYLNLAILAGRRGETEAAVDGYRCALQLGDTSVTVLWNLAMAEAHAGHTEEAESLLAQLIAAHPEAAADAWMFRARLAAEKGNGIDAERALKQVVALRPERWEAQLNLGVLLFRRGAITEALACFERACQINPAAAEAVRAQAAAALETGDMKRVSTLRRRLNELGHPAPELTYHLGLWLESQGRWDDAVRAYSEALKENPSFVEALVRLGQMLARRGRPQEAADCWRRVLSLRPELAQSYFDSAAG
jgi:tetratricopeptide (TPR) repeat protein